jgi:hypothetical protein
MSDRQPVADIIEETQVVVEAAGRRQVDARLIGGLAVRFHAAEGLHPAFARPYKDIDLVVTRGSAGELVRLLADLGYEPNQVFNAMNGNRRMLFYDTANGRQLDVFVASFAMCHAIPLSGRLHVDPISVPLAELLLTKLQVVQLNEKDRRDALAIVHHHEVADHDDDAVNAVVISQLLASDWGLWRTATMNLDKAGGALEDYRLSEDEQSRVRGRLDDLRSRIDEQPKSARWKMRSRIGDRVRWYDEPEEVD